jgi:hypothetical protein
MQQQSMTSDAGQAIELFNLNPNISAQHVLQIGKKRYHLQFPAGSTVDLSADGISYVLPGEAAKECKLGDGKLWSIKVSRKVAFSPICDGRIYVRHSLYGWKQKIRTRPEMLQSWASWTTPAEAQEDSESNKPSVTSTRSSLRAVVESMIKPPAANVKPAHTKTTVGARQLGIAIAGPDKQRMHVGQWYPTRHFGAMYASVVTLAHTATEFQKTFPKRVRSLAANGGARQVNAMVYLLAMDLTRYTLNWMHGTDHPGVAWSRRHRLKRSNRYGPDGFSKLAPFVPAAAVSPVDLPSTVGTFSGGFQRRHGAFKWGARAKTADAHHYGFIEDGVVLSTLMPGLATIVGYRDGRIALKTWTKADDKTIANLRFARQNGVPLMIGGGPDNVGEPGLLVGNWGHGNWSGSAKAELRTPRSAACLIEHDGARWLVYAYFSTHTPSGMARVLQAYGCDYAVHLDMNSPGHAYFALFTRLKPQLDTLEFRVEHLMTQMRGWDPKINRKRTPRYLLKPEYKDFFYIMRK